MAHQSSWSQGKGRRRTPGRQGGAGRTHPGLPQLPTRPIPRTVVRGDWQDIEPPRLPKQFREHPFLFAWYHESATHRPDGNSYDAFLFRDRDWTQFGMRELAQHPGIRWKDLINKFAIRVVTDSAFRKRMKSEDPDLPEMWKRR